MLTVLVMVSTLDSASSAIDYQHASINDVCVAVLAWIRLAGLSLKTDNDGEGISSSDGNNEGETGDME